MNIQKLPRVIELLSKRMAPDDVLKCLVKMYSTEGDGEVDLEAAATDYSPKAGKAHGMDSKLSHKEKAAVREESARRGRNVEAFEGRFPIAARIAS